MPSFAKPRQDHDPKISRLALSLALASCLLFAASPATATIVGSKHDLSTSGDSEQTCAFCHTPHGSNTDVVTAPLWNRFVDMSKIFTLYSSATLDTSPGAPNSSVSMVCLGCHDGVLGTATFNSISGSDKHDLINAPGPGGTPDTTSSPNCARCHAAMFGGPPAMWLGTDLTDDHPISMTYPTAPQDPAFYTPPDLINGWPDMPLFDGKVECPTCHKVHDPTIVPFMRLPVTSSQICVTCHMK